MRSTNVYEDRSIGVFEEDEEEGGSEDRFDEAPSPTSYIAYHVGRLSLILTRHSDELQTDTPAALF